MNPYAILAASGLWLASVAAAGWWAYGAGRNAELATQVREDRVAAVATQAAASAAAGAISKIEVKNVTVRQQLEREIQTHEVYRDCRSGPAAVGLLNATPGIAAAAPASAPGGGQLPGAGASR